MGDDDTGADGTTVNGGAGNDAGEADARGTGGERDAFRSPYGPRRIDWGESRIGSAGGSRIGRPLSGDDDTGDGGEAAGAPASAPTPSVPRLPTWGTPSAIGLRDDDGPVDAAPPASLPATTPSNDTPPGPWSPPDPATRVSVPAYGAPASGAPASGAPTSVRPAYVPPVPRGPGSGGPSGPSASTTGAVPPRARRPSRAWFVLPAAVVVTIVAAVTGVNVVAGLTDRPDPVFIGSESSEDDDDDVYDSPDDTEFPERPGSWTGEMADYPGTFVPETGGLEPYSLEPAEAPSADLQFASAYSALEATRVRVSDELGVEWEPRENLQSDYLSSAEYPAEGEVEFPTPLRDYVLNSSHLELPELDYDRKERVYAIAAEEFADAGFTTLRATGDASYPQCRGIAGDSSDDPLETPAGPAELFCSSSDMADYSNLNARMPEAINSSASVAIGEYDGRTLLSVSVVLLYVLPEADRDLYVEHETRLAAEAQ